jgi:hypothetical protein
MERKNILRLVFYFVLVGALFGIFLFPALGQTPTQTSPASSVSAAAPGELEALAAPIALWTWLAEAESVGRCHSRRQGPASYADSNVILACQFTANTSGRPASSHTR